MRIQWFNKHERILASENDTLFQSVILRRRMTLNFKESLQYFCNDEIIELQFICHRGKNIKHNQYVNHFFSTIPFSFIIYVLLFSNKEYLSGRKYDLYAMSIALANCFNRHMHMHVKVKVTKAQLCRLNFDLCLLICKLLPILVHFEGRI